MGKLFILDPGDSPMCYQKGPYKIKSGKGEGNGARDWRDMAINQGMLAATRNWKKWGNDPSYPIPKALEREWPCQCLDFGPVTLISEFLHLELWETKYLLH